MPRLAIRTWQKDPTQFATRLRVRDHRGFLGRRFRVPQGSVLLTDEANQLCPSGHTPPPESAGLLLKTRAQRVTITLDQLRSKDEHMVAATLAVSFAVPCWDVAPLAAFRRAFGLDSSAGRVSVQAVQGWLCNQIRGGVASFTGQRDARELVEAGALDIVTELDNVLRANLQSCRTWAGIHGLLVEACFESPEYEKQREESRRRRREVREKEFDAECRLLLSEIEAKQRQSQELTRLDVEKTIKAKEHEIWKQGRLLEIDREELWAHLEKNRCERIQAVLAQREATRRIEELDRPIKPPSTVQPQVAEGAPASQARYAPQDVLDLLSQLRSWPVEQADGDRALWALFAAFLLVAACAGFVLVLSMQGAAGHRLETLIDSLRNRQALAPPSSAQAEPVIATVNVYRVVGKRPYEREIPGVLTITGRVISFRSTGASAVAAQGFDIPVAQIREVAWKGEREPITMTTEPSLDYVVFLSASQPQSEITSSVQLYEVLRDLRGKAATVPFDQ